MRSISVLTTEEDLLCWGTIVEQIDVTADDSAFKYSWVDYTVNFNSFLFSLYVGKQDRQCAGNR